MPTANCPDSGDLAVSSLGTSPGPSGVLIVSGGRVQLADEEANVIAEAADSAESRRLLECIDAGSMYTGELDGSGSKITFRTE